MELQRRQDQNHPERKGQKRKLEEEIGDEREISVKSGEARKALLSEVSEQVKVLNSTFSWSEADRASAKRATHVLAELAKNGWLHKIPKTPSDLVRISVFSSLLSVLQVSSVMLVLVLFGINDFVCLCWGRGGSERDR